MTREELVKRCSEVWPKTCFKLSKFGEGIEEVTRDGTNAVLLWSYITNEPNFYNHLIRTKRGMKRRPQALAYVCGERNDFND